MKRVGLLLVALFVVGGPLLIPSSNAAPAALVDAEAGKTAFQTYCQNCHTATSTDTKVGPGLLGLFKRKKMPASGRPLTEDNVRSQILNGGNGMPGFKAAMDADEINSLIAYLKTI